MNSSFGIRLRVVSFVLLAATLLPAAVACGKDSTKSAAASTGSPAAPASAVGDPPSAAAGIVEARCTRCHTAERIERHRGKDHAWWEDTVSEMVEKGARLSDTERAALIDYLSTPR